MDDRRQRLDPAGAARIPAAWSVPPPPPAPPGGLPDRDLAGALAVLDQALDMVWCSATDAATARDLPGGEAGRERYRAAVIAGARGMVLAALGAPAGALALAALGTGRRRWIHGGTGDCGEGQGGG